MFFLKYLQNFVIFLFYLWHIGKSWTEGFDRIVGVKTDRCDKISFEKVVLSTHFWFLSPSLSTLNIILPVDIMIEIYHLPPWPSRHDVGSPAKKGEISQNYHTLTFHLHLHAYYWTIWNHQFIVLSYEERVNLRLW